MSDHGPGDGYFSPLWPRHNLFRNPFGELSRDERAELAIVDVDPILAHLCRCRTAFQLIGDCGRGKTTRMLALRRQIPDCVYTYLPMDEPCPPIPAASVVLIDEAQRMPRRVRQQVFRSGLPLLLATHRDLRGPLRRAGYAVRTQLIGQRLDPTLLGQILNARLNASRRNPGAAAPQVSVSDCSELINRFGTNIRAIESYLYDVVQTQVNSHGEMRFIHPA